MPLRLLTLQGLRIQSVSPISISSLHYKLEKEITNVADLVVVLFQKLSAEHYDCWSTVINPVQSILSFITVGRYLLLSAGSFNFLSRKLKLSADSCKAQIWIWYLTIDRQLQVPAESLFIYLLLLCLTLT